MNKLRLIPPLVMLTATALVAVIAYLRDFPFATWLVTVVAVMVLFLFLGEMILQMIEYFYKINEEKEKQEAEEEEGESLEGESEEEPVAGEQPLY